MAFRSTGVPQGFSELPVGWFVYMLVASGKVMYVGAGQNPWGEAEKLRRRYRADRVLFRPTAVGLIEDTLGALIDHYQPPHNFPPMGAQLAELGMLLEN